MLNTFARREELLGLVGCYRTLKADLGLMDFSDQIELGARLATERPEVGAAERAKYRVVLLDEYQDTSVAQARMLLPAVLRRREAQRPRPRGDRGRRPQPGDLRLARRLGLQHPRLRRRLPDAPTARPTCRAYAAHRQPPLRRAGSWRPPTSSPSRCYDQFPQVRAARGQARRRARAPSGRPVHETYDDELAWLAGAGAEAHAADGGAALVARSGCSPATTRTAADVFDALTARRDPGRDRRPAGAAPAARGRRGGRHAARCSTTSPPTPQLLTLLTGPRWAIGAARPGAARAPGPRARRRRRPRPATPSGPSSRSWPPRSRAPTRPRWSRSATRSTTRGGRSTTPPEARERFALLAAELRRLRRHAGEPLLDLVRRIIDTTGIDVELASSVSPAAAGPPRQPRPVRQGRRRVPGRRRRGDACRRCSPTSRPRTSSATGSTWRPRPRPTRSSCSPSTGPRAWSGTRSSWSACAAEKFPDLGRPAPSGPPARACCPTRCAATRATCPSSAAGPPRTSRPSPRTARTTSAQEELRLGYVALTRARHELVVSSLLLDGRAQGPARPVALPGSRPRGDGGVGREARAAGRTSRPRARPTR